MPDISIIKTPRCIVCGKELDQRQTFLSMCRKCRVFLCLAVRREKVIFEETYILANEKDRIKIKDMYRKIYEEVE